MADQQQTTNPTVTTLRLVPAPAAPTSGFERFESPASKVVQVPKPEMDEKRKGNG